MRETKSQSLLSKLHKIDDSIHYAISTDMLQLAYLYGKGLTAAGFARLAAPENREELHELAEKLCNDYKLLTIRDSLGPISLMHYEPGLAEIKMIVARADKVRQGYGTRMLHAIATAAPSAKIHPVTKLGEGLARKCGFSPKVDDGSTWVRNTYPPQRPLKWRPAFSDPSL